MPDEPKTLLFSNSLSRLAEGLSADRAMHGLGVASGRSLLTNLKDAYRAWIGAVAHSLAGRLSGLSSARVLTLVENETGELELANDPQLTDAPLHSKQLVLHGERVEVAGNGLSPTALAGWVVELVLRPDRFLLRPLELPARAAEFLDGIVRAQIDRLTPWNTHEATYGWSQPVALENDRIAISVAAASKDSIAPFLEALCAYGANSVAIFTETSEAG